MNITRDIVSAHLASAAPLSRKHNGDERHTCPRCGGAGKLEYSRPRGLYYCHRCGLGGKLSNRQVVQSPPSWQQPEEIVDRLDLYQPCELLSPQMDYLLEQRKLPLEIALSLEPHMGPEKDYAYLPLFSGGSDHPSYFVGRLINGRSNKPRYLNPPGSHFRRSRNDCLWGVQRIQRGCRRLVICEGIFDACWGKDRIATLGTAVGQSQVQAICRLQPESITVMFDGSAFTQGVNLSVHLSEAYPGPISVARLPKGSDPDNLRDSGEEYLRQAERIV